MLNKTIGAPSEAHHLSYGHLWPSSPCSLLWFNQSHISVKRATVLRVLAVGETLLKTYNIPNLCLFSSSNIVKIVPSFLCCMRSEEESVLVHCLQGSNDDSFYRIMIDHIVCR